MNSRIVAVFVMVVFVAATLAAAGQENSTAESDESEASVFDATLFRDGNKIVFGPGIFSQQTFLGSEDDPIALEAQIAGDVPLWGQEGVDMLSTTATVGGRRVWSSQAYATMMVRLRMMNTTSAPVAPPSFMPKFTYQGVGLLRKRNNRSSMVVVNAVFGHHSNGQSGCSLEDQPVEDIVTGGKKRGTRCLPVPENVAATIPLNVATGNFSTHYVQAGVYHRVLRTATGQGRSREFVYGGSIEQHQFGMKGAIAPELVDRYGMTQVEGFYGMSFDRMGFIDRWDMRASVRFVLQNTVRYRYALASEHFLYFRARPDIGVFFRLYQGRDYYNINFENNVARLEIGATFNWENIFRALPRPF